MPILSSDEYIAFENQRLLNGLPGITSEINETSSASFGHSTSPVVETALLNKDYIGFIQRDNKIVASGFGSIDPDYHTTPTICIHSFSVNNEYRGRGLCQTIVSEFNRKFGRKYIIYLTVRTEAGNVNESAIRCYEKQGFIMLPQVYRDHTDGKNSAMIRVLTPPKRTIRKTRAFRKKSKRKRRKIK